MKKQLTTLITLISLSWSVSTMASITQPTELQPVNSTVIAVEINLEQPQLNLKASIIDQVTENLQRHSAQQGTLLIARESNKALAQQTITRSE